MSQSYPHCGPGWFVYGNHPAMPCSLTRTAFWTSVMFFAGLLVWPHPVAAEWVEWIADAKVGITYNDNVNQTFFKDEKESSTAGTPFFSIGRYSQLTDFTRLRITTDLEASVHKEFELLNYYSAGLMLTMKHKLGIGPNVPRLGAHVSATTENVRDNARDSSIYNIGLMVEKRFTPRLDVRIGYDYDIRNGKDGELTMKNIMHDPVIDTDVFDQKKHTLSFIGNYLVINNVLMTAGYSYMRGDFISTCALDKFDRVWDEENVTATTSDNVFGGLIYLMKGTAHVLSLDASYGLGRHTSLNLGYQHQEGRGNKFVWKSSIVRANFMYSY